MILLLAAGMMACLTTSRWAVAQFAKGNPALAPPVKVRLPAFYNKVVTDEQREKIYAIQRTFGQQIKDLENQIAALEAKRDLAVDDVLTPQQRARVAQLQAEADAEKLKKAVPAAPMQPEARPPARRGAAPRR
jgi:hypothetical protein